MMMMMMMVVVMVMQSATNCPLVVVDIYTIIIMNTAVNIP